MGFLPQKRRNIFDQAHALEFRTYDECERERKGMYDGWFGTNGRPGTKDDLDWVSSAIEARTEVIKYQRCIASDDPRLKEKWNEAQTNGADIFTSAMTHRLELSWGSRQTHL